MPPFYPYKASINQVAVASTNTKVRFELASIRIEPELRLLKRSLSEAYGVLRRVLSCICSVTYVRVDVKIASAKSSCVCQYLDAPCTHLVDANVQHLERKVHSSKVVPIV